MKNKLILWLDVSFIKELKKRAIDENVSVSQLIFRVLTEYLKTELK